MDVVVHQQINVMVHGNNNSLEDNFMCLYLKNSMHDLILTTEDGFCIITGTVKEILKDEKWWYPTCSCNSLILLHFFPRCAILVMMIKNWIPYLIRIWWMTLTMELVSRIVLS